MENWKRVTVVIWTSNITREQNKLSKICGMMG